MDHMVVGGTRRESVDRLIKMTEIAEPENPKRALEYARDAFEEARADGYVFGIAASLMRQGRIYWLLSDHETASKNLLDSLEISKKNGYALLEAESYNCLGNIFCEMENFDRALENYMTALRIVVREGLTELEGRIYNNIGLIYMELRDYDSAHEYFGKSMLVLEAMDVLSLRGLLPPLINMAELNVHRESFETAIEFLEQADTMAESAHDTIAIAQILQLKGKIYLKTGRLDAAVESFEQSVSLASESSHLLTSVLVSMDLHEAYIRSGEEEKAVSVLKRAMQLAEQSKNWSLIFKGALALASFYEGQDQYEEALSYYKKYYEAERQFESERTETRLRNLTSQFRIEQTQNEKELYRLKNIELKEKADELQKKSLELETINSKLHVISKISQDITSSLDLFVIFERIYAHLQEVMDVKVCGLAIYDEWTEEIEFKAFIENGNRIKDVPKIPANHKTSLAALCLRQREAVVIRNIERDASEIGTSGMMMTTDEVKVKSVVYLPLVFEQHIVGVLTVQSGRADAYGPESLELLKLLSNHIAIATNNAAKSDKLEKEIQKRKEAQTDLEELSHRLLNLSQIDGLTGVSNRRRFDEAMDFEWKRSFRENLPLSVMFIDVDYFKQYNDTYGHIQGDQCLIRVANTLRACLKRGTDLIARYGGDEFVVLLANTDIAGAKAVSDKMMEAMSGIGIRHEISPHDGRLTITIGVATKVPTVSGDQSHIMELADRALYHAKQSGRNKVHHHQE